MCSHQTQNKQYQFVACHQKPSRSFFKPNGEKFPVCARCLGEHVGYLSFFVFTFNFLYIGWLWSVLIILPNLLDGLTQGLVLRESNNFLRLSAGFFASVGQMSILSLIGKWISDWILTFIQ